MPDKFDVGYVAKLCRLELTEEETERYQGQLDKILDYIQILETLDLEGIEPTAHASPVYDVMREDEPRECLSREDALKNAPQEALDQFAVTKVVE